MNDLDWILLIVGWVVVGIFLFSFFEEDWMTCYAEDWIGNLIFYTIAWPIILIYKFGKFVRSCF